ncbi:MAG: type II toxin-antitoxin system VapC family toxin [Bacteroidales bacterium]|nr:type II toxin-antitoxin system VapC family toxin [Bacteroidales bacterium]
MGNQGYLIDTNVAIGYIGGDLTEKALNLLDGIIDGQFYISVINKIELLGFAGITKNEELKFGELINAANILGLDEEIVNGTIAIRKQYRSKLPDAIIAATAIVHGFTLVTRNIKDFKNMQGLDMLDPYNL